MNRDETLERTRDDYAALVAEGVSAGSERMATVLYSEIELSAVPREALGLAMGIGNPARHARLASGMSVLDLGSGVGVDGFVAASMVGGNGRVLGIDLTPSVVETARRLAELNGIGNVQFLVGSADDLSLLESDSFDVVIGNGVVNLVPDRQRLFSDAYRVLRNGGTTVFSDLAVDGEVPPELIADPAAWSG